MESAPEAIDIQSYRRSLALRQVEMLTLVAEISLKLAEGAGARALAIQAREAAPAGEAQAAMAPDAGAGPPAPSGRDPGLAFTGYARTMQVALAQRARALDRLCAADAAQAAEREAGRQDRRTRHRDEVDQFLRGMIWDEVEDLDRCEALSRELSIQLDTLYELGAEEVRVEDRPVGAVMAGLACGLGLSEEWRRWAPGWPVTRPPGPPAGSPDEIRAERTRRRDAAAAAVGRMIADVDDPARIPGLEAGLAVRLQEFDVIALLDTECTFTVADRLCRSLGIGTYAEAPPDTG
jgi:hypothetical protein